MFIDAQAIPAGVTVHADICIIGSGPAGLALAREFDGTATRVAVLESGGLEFDEFAATLQEGEVAGLPYPALETVRMRAFGGTAGHWGGNIRPLEDIDLAPRPEIGRDGWPFARAELDPYYARARAFFGLPDTVFDRAYWSARNGAPWDFANGAVVSQVFHTVADPAAKSGTFWHDAFARSENIRVYLHATVVDIEADGGVRAVQGVRAATPDGRRLDVRADRFVLAAGGIENARILLLCDRQQRGGLGNDHGLVGKYFQEHLTDPDFALLFPSDPHLRLGFYKGGQHPWGYAWGVLRLADRVLRENALTNIRFQLATVTNAFNADMDRPGMVSLQKLTGRRTMFPKDDPLEHFARVVADIDAVAGAAWQRLVNHPDYPLRRIDVVQIGEQIPSAASRVRLSDERDALGQRRAVLDWRVTEADSEAAAKTARLLAKFVGESGLGRLADRLPEGGFAARPPKPHYHHMGTTRMHDDPRRGVVDRDCRVHRLANFYVAGSSVFPTGGNANPTYTIVALAIRPADHLKERAKA